MICNDRGSLPLVKPQAKHCARENLPFAALFPFVLDLKMYLYLAREIEQNLASMNHDRTLLTFRASII